nr:hypothetical protein [Deltaproteobacteria bacterium]
LSTRAPKLGVPHAVDQLCRKALARDPSQRWQSAAQLGEAIEEIYRDTVGEASGPRSVSRPLGGGSLVLAGEDDTSEIRLRRSDLDAFESSIRRRRVLVWLVTVLLALGCVGFAVWYFTMRVPPTLTVEREPNDELHQSNAIATGTAVTGYLGKRRAANEGDRDAYLVDWPQGSRRVVSVKVTAPPNIDVMLSISSEHGLHGASIDEVGLGQTEVVHRRVIVGPLLVTVGQVLGQEQRLPTENVSDPYTLEVAEEVMDAGETEPNGIAADANPLRPTYELRGYLDSRSDVDLLRWAGPSGAHIVVVRADGVPLQWRTSDGKARTPGEARLELQQGELIRIERTDRDAGEPKQDLAGRDAPWSIVVVR